MKRFIKAFVCLLAIVASLQFGNEAFASRYNRSKARNVISKTAYIIDQAYDVANYYNYWSSSYLSRAVYYNDYAQELYHHRSYRSAIRYSLRAREYALYVIDNCDDYWEFFYYTYYGWSHVYGYNPSFAYSAGYRDGFYDGYYAAYCDRHYHDYRHDPHYRPNGHYNNRPNVSTTVIGRGNTGTVTSGNHNGGGTTITRPGFVPSSETEVGNYKNLSLGEYFSNEEKTLLKDLPNEKILENDFRSNKPNVSFNDQALSKNKSVLERNKTNAQSFSKKEDSKAISRVSIERPVKISTEKNSQSKTTPVVKPIRNTNSENTGNNPIAKPIDKRNNSENVPLKKPEVKNREFNRENKTEKPVINRPDNNRKSNTSGKTSMERKFDNNRNKDNRGIISRPANTKPSNPNASKSRNISKSSSVSKSNSVKPQSRKISTEKSNDKNSDRKLQRR